MLKYLSKTEEISSTNFDYAKYQFTIYVGKIRYLQTSQDNGRQKVRKHGNITDIKNLILKVTY